MALFTEAEIISLGLSDYSSIELDAIEDDVYQVTKNDFAVKEWDISDITSNVITTDETHNIIVGDYIRIYIDDTLAYGGVFTVTAVTDTTITISETIPDIESSGTVVKIKYPSGIKVLASRYLKNLAQASGIKSESIGRYSVTYDKEQFESDLQAKYGKYFRRDD